MLSTLVTIPKLGKTFSWHWWELMMTPFTFNLLSSLSSRFFLNILWMPYLRIKILSLFEPFGLNLFLLLNLNEWIILEFIALFINVFTSFKYLVNDIFFEFLNDFVMIDTLITSSFSQIIWNKVNIMYNFLFKSWKKLDFTLHWNKHEIHRNEIEI